MAGNACPAGAENTGVPLGSERCGRLGRWRLRLPLRAVVATVSLLTIAGPVFGATTTRKVVTRIDISGTPVGGNPSGGSGTFTLRSGSTTDSGSMSYSFFGNPMKGSVTLTGKHGELDMSLTSRPSGLNVDSQGLDLWTGTWKIASGTGAYAGAKGVGAYLGIIGPNYQVKLHFEGFRT